MRTPEYGTTGGLIMKIKLIVSDERYAEIEKEMLEKGFEIDEEADLILSERDLYSNYLVVKCADCNEHVRISVHEIVFIESYGHDIQVHVCNGKYKAAERLHQLEKMLDPEQFLRISNSVIIARDKVKKIRPTLSSKFILTMSDGQSVDVTRSYYNIFRDSFGI